MTDTALLVRIAGVAFVAAGVCIVGDALAGTAKRAAAWGRSAVVALLTCVLILAAVLAAAILAGELPNR